MKLNRKYTRKKRSAKIISSKIIQPSSKIMVKNNNETHKQVTESQSSHFKILDNLIEKAYLTVLKRLPSIEESENLIKKYEHTTEEPTTFNTLEEDLLESTELKNILQKYSNKYKNMKITVLTLFRIMRIISKHM